MKRKTLKFLSIGIVGVAAISAAVQPVMASETDSLSVLSEENSGVIITDENSENTENTESSENVSEENSEDNSNDVAPELSPSTVVIEAYNTDAGRYIDDATFEIKDNSGNLITFNKLGSGSYEVASSGDRYVETYNGSVEIKGLNGSYVVKNTTPDGDVRCNTSEQTFSISPEERRSMTFEFSANYGTLRVTFLGEDDSAIPNAVFRIKNSNGNLIYFAESGGIYEYNGNSNMSEIATNSTGMATLHLPGGNYTIEQVSAPAEYNGDMVTKSVSVNNQEDVGVTLVNVKKYGALSVNVTDAVDDDIKLTGATFVITASNGDNIYVVGSGNGRYTFSRTSGENSLVSAGGVINIESLPEGSYTITQKGGANGYEMSAAKQFDIKANQTTNIAFRNEKSVGTIKITINDEETGKPIEGFKYKILADDKETVLKFRMSAKGYNYDENGSEEVESDENGEIILEKLPVGTYYLQQTEAASGYLLDVDAIPHVVEVGKENVYATKAVKSNSTIVIVDVDGNVVEGVKFDITDANGDKVLSDETDEEGKFVINGLKAGEYKLSITQVPETFAKYTKVMTFKLDEKGQAENLGRITLEFNKATLNLGKEGVEVVLVSADGSSISVKTDAKGIATFTKLSYGEYTIKLADETIKFSPIVFTVDEAFDTVAYNVDLVETAPDENTEKSEDGGITAMPETTASKKVNNNVIIIIIAVIVGLAGGVAAYFYNKKRKAAAADANDDTVDGAVKVGYDEDGNVVLYSETEEIDENAETAEDDEVAEIEDADEMEVVEEASEEDTKAEAEDEKENTSESEETADINTDEDVDTGAIDENKDIYGLNESESDIIGTEEQE